MEKETVKTTQGQIEFSIRGKGKPILLLHGGHSNCQETLFHKGFDTGKYQLITPSRPGYGNTPLDNNNTPEKAANLIISLLNHLNINKVVVYAVSAGGLTSIEIAGNYPDRVEKLILASAVTKKWLNQEGDVYKTAKLLFNPKTEKVVWGMVRFFSKLFPRMIANNFYPQFSSKKPHKLSEYDIKELLNTFKHYHSKVGFMSDIEHNISSDLIAKIKCPTLIIHSKNDNSVSYEHAVYAKRRIKNSELLGLDNEWGHLFWIGNDASETLRKIIKFIEK